MTANRFPITKLHTNFSNILPKNIAKLHACIDVYGLVSTVVNKSILTASLVIACPKNRVHRSGYNSSPSSSTTKAESVVERAAARRNISLRLRDSVLPSGCRSIPLISRRYAPTPISIKVIKVPAIPCSKICPKLYKNLRRLILSPSENIIGGRI